MHELSVTQALLDIALRHAAGSPGARISEVRVVLGDLASVVDDCVRFYWDEIVRETACEGAALVFDRVPARVRCADCEHEYGLERELRPCPVCDGVSARVVSGDECYLDSIILETAAPAAGSPP